MNIFAPALAGLEFVDLYLGPDFSDYSIQPGAYAPRQELSESFATEAGQVRERCAGLAESTGESTFTISIGPGDVLCRVQVLHDLYSQAVYILRRIASEIRPMERLGLPSAIVEQLMVPTRRGLILVCGEIGTGKTTTASSLLVGRLHRLGGRALAVEDPPECRLNGVHGRGRCLQVPVSKKHGGYTEQIRAGMRSGVSSLLIGEIRCAETAREATAQSINGMTVFATIHGKDPPDAIQRLRSWATAGEQGLGQAASEILASGLTAVIHQRIDRNSGTPRAIFRTLLVDGEGVETSAIRSKIKNGQLQQLGDDMDRQLRQMQWRNE